MKTFKHILPLLLTVLWSCTPEAVPSDAEWEEQILYATAPSDDSPGSRTALNPEDNKKVLWSPRENIDIFYSGGHYQFTGTNETPVATATFTGYAPAISGAYIALYPSNEASYSDGTYIYTSLDAVQTGKAGTFADGYLITADDAIGNTISFNHVCSGLRFRVSGDDVSAVTIRGNNGEKIAGDFRFRFTAPDTPVAEDGSEESVTLTAPDGGFFESGKYYYIVTLPAVFTQGLTLTVTKGGETYQLRFSSSVSFTRGVFKNISGYLDERCCRIDPESRGTYYGPQNSFCLRPGQVMDIDVQPRIITDGWQRSGLPATGNAAATAQVIWGSATASLSGNTLSMSSSTAGSSLVAIKDFEGTILWSYLLWVTESAPVETTLPGGAVILPALGGNCYFQWGRKDPLISGCPVMAHPGDANALPASVQNPASFIDQGTSCSDWYAAESYGNQDGTLWGGESVSKTVWDPCPSGYRVPKEADFNVGSLTGSDSGSFEKLGILLPGGSVTAPNADYGWDAYCWTRSPLNYEACALRMRTDGNGFLDFGAEGDVRYLAMPVRCIKE